MVTGYMGDPPESGNAFRDGWFYPGDVGCLRPDGMLVILGRTGTVLNLGGDKVRPERVEDVLASFAGVTDAAVFTRANDLGVPQLFAVVVAGPGFDEPALRKHCEARLGTALTPVCFLAVESLPRNAAGKLDRAALPQLAAN